MEKIILKNVPPKRGKSVVLQYLRNSKFSSVVSYRFSASYFFMKFSSILIWKMVSSKKIGKINFYEFPPFSVPRNVISSKFSLIVFFFRFLLKIVLLFLIILYSYMKDRFKQKKETINFYEFCDQFL